MHAAAPYCRAFCIVDTGSTDDTVAIARRVAADMDFEAAIFNHTWKNFGESRTESYKACQQFCQRIGLNPATTYALLLDADMVICGTGHLAGRQPGYQIIQRNGTSLEYPNIRLLRMDVPWKCIGSTHEYWSSGSDSPCQLIDRGVFWIDDRNDGGCKADKFQRDKAFLMADLTADPSNARAQFYLAQTYMCLGEYKEAATAYQRRIELGGWRDEIWYSMYKIACCHIALGQAEYAELWASRAHLHTPTRAEAFYALCRHYRIKGSYWKAMHYYHVGKQIPHPGVGLFIENNVYNYLFDYEYTIIGFYTGQQHVLNACVEYYNRNDPVEFKDSVWSNMEFYVEQPRGTILTELNLPAHGQFQPSSCSFIDMGTLNIRYVNYSIEPDGAYTLRDASGICYTKNSNGTKFLPDSVDLPIINSDSLVRGLEDIRLFRDASGNTLYTATTMEYSVKPRVLFGHYDSHTYMKNRLLEPPIETAYEKNWAPIDGSAEPRFVYSWHPLQIGTIGSDDNRLKITHTHATPHIFGQMRGSTPLYHNAEANEYWAIVHLVKYGSPRKYYHSLVILDATTYAVKRYSLPFIFEAVQIEYCLSAYIADKQLHTIVSRNDSKPAWAHIPLESLAFLEVA
jgi:tetratricopeptide (TPR) repeat protein